MEVTLILRQNKLKLDSVLTPTALKVNGSHLYASEKKNIALSKPLQRVPGSQKR